MDLSSRYGRQAKRRYYRDRYKLKVFENSGIDAPKEFVICFSAVGVPKDNWPPEEFLQIYLNAGHIYNIANGTYTLKSKDIAHKLVKKIFVSDYKILDIPGCYPVITFATQRAAEIGLYRFLVWLSSLRKISSSCCLERRSYPF